MQRRQDNPQRSIVEQHQQLLKDKINQQSNNFKEDEEMPLETSQSNNEMSSSNYTSSDDEDDTLLVTSTDDEDTLSCISTYDEDFEDTLSSISTDDENFEDYINTVADNIFSERYKELCRCMAEEAEEEANEFLESLNIPEEDLERLHMPFLPRVDIPWSVFYYYKRHGS